MEPRELAALSRSKAGEAEPYPGGSVASRADPMEGLAGGPLSPPPPPTLGKGLLAAGEHPDPDEEDEDDEEEEDDDDEEDLGPGRDVDASSNAGSEKWAMPGEGLEEQEFSIKEASFQEGSLKLKIQTTKRAKKPPKNLENYICPPEIRITIKQPGERASKQARSSKGGKEEDKGLPKKKTIEKPFKLTEQNGSNPGDFLGESMKPKHQPRSTLKNQLDWAKPSVGVCSSQGNITDSEAKKQPVGVTKGSHSDSTSSLAGLQLKKITESQPLNQFAPGMSSQISGLVMQPSSIANMSLTSQQDSNLIMPTSVSKDRGLQEVAEQVFGNIKRKYGRKDTVRYLVTHNSDLQWGKKVENVFESKNPDTGKEKLTAESVEVPYRGTEIPAKVIAEDCELLTGSTTPQADECKGNPGRKRRYRRSPREQIPSDDFPEDSRAPEISEKADRGFLEPRVPNKTEPRSTKVVVQSQPEAVEKTVTVGPGQIEACLSRLRKHPVSRSEDAIPLKAKDRGLYQKSKRSSLPKDGSGTTSGVPEPPSAYPITPSSPLYANTDSLTVITPIKKKRGRPKKQPLLTVETIHEGTSTSPVSPIARESPSSLKQRRKKRKLASLVQMATINETPASQLKLNKRIGYAGVHDKKSIQTVNKMKLVKMQNMLNEILSCPTNSSRALKSMEPMSDVVSTVASTIEARLGKQINVSKRGTIYIGKKRGRKPRAVLMDSQDEHKTSDKHPVPSQFENLVVPSSSPPSAGMPSPRTLQPLSAQAAGAGGILCPATTDASPQEPKTMPNLQPISALPMKIPKGLHSGSWKLSPPRLMANSPSHLSEVASLKEVTLSPVSESHSEETIPSDSGIGTDNNSTSDQAEKGPASRRRYSFDFCTLEGSEVPTLEAPSKAMRGHCSKRVAAAGVENFLTQESMKKQKHRRKRKGLQRPDDLQFLADLEELIGKFQVFRVSHRGYNFYPENMYPSIFRINFDHYYPMPYFPYDPLHYLRRNSEIKSKRRRGRPAKASEPMTKMPFIQGFGYPIPSSNYYAPYTMPYTSMPITTSMMNLGYYGQYQPPFYLSHTLGSTSSPFMRPALPVPQFHPSGHVKFATGAKHKTKHGSQQIPLAGMGGGQSTLGALKGGNGGGLPSVRLHKHKHKHKQKQKEDHLSGAQREGLSGLFSSGKSSGFLSLLSSRLDTSDKETSAAKLRDKQRRDQSTDALSRSSRNVFERTNPLSTLSDSHQSRRVRDQGRTGDFHITCPRQRERMGDFHTTFSRQQGESARVEPGLTLDLLRGAPPSREEEFGIRGRRQVLESFGMYREQNTETFGGLQVDPLQQMFTCPSPSSIDRSPQMKRRLKRKEVEEIQCEVRKMCSFSKILTTKKNLDHVNKILKVKRLQRQAKTGNNVVKKRRGRPRKQAPPADQEPLPRMPVLERCADPPGRKVSPFGQDSVMDAIESVVHMARTPPNRGGAKCWMEEDEGRAKRPRRCRGPKEAEEAIAIGRKPSLPQADY